MEEDDGLDTLASDPGATAAGSDPQNLDVNFSPTLANLIPSPSPDTAPSMDTEDTFLNDLTDGAYGDGATDTGLTTAANSFLGSLGTIGSNLVNAFVTNPQNAATAQSTADNNAAINLAESSQLFGYLIFGLVIFLAFQIFGKDV